MAKREAELKKAQESDSLKAKRIRNLEAQLDEARKRGYNENEGIEDSEVISNLLSLLKIENLEEKTKKLEHQVELLFSKIENPSPAKRNPSKCYICDVCDVEFERKIGLKKHQEEAHLTLYHCEKCEFTSGNSQIMNDHKRKHSLHHTCTKCSFRAASESDLEQHKLDVHMKCNLCSYHGIHRKDLNRHKNTMHSKAYHCEQCKYIATSASNLKIHKQNEHWEELANDCNPGDNEYRRNWHPNRHHTMDHQFTQRTRIFSSSRRPSTSVSVNPSQDLFRPWSPSSSRAGPTHQPLAGASNISQPRSSTTTYSQSRTQD